MSGSAFSSSRKQAAKRLDDTDSTTGSVTSAPVPPDVTDGSVTPGQALGAPDID